MNLSVHGAPGVFKRASVQQVKGEVTVKKENSNQSLPATVNTTIEGKDVIQTGRRSRVELEFQDQSICRLGSNTVFSFDPNSRDMAFSKGVAVVHVPPGQGGARIATPAATAAISGDTVVIRATTTPQGESATQFTSLSPRGGPTEGNIQITLGSNPKESFVLQPGQLAVVPDAATKISQIARVEIDVATFAQKSAIIQNLPPSAAQELSTVVERQSSAFSSGRAVRTPYAVVGTKVVKADANGNFTTKPSTPTSSSGNTQESGSALPAGGGQVPLAGDGTDLQTLGGSGTIDTTGGTGIEGQTQIFVNGGFDQFGNQTFDPRLLSPITGAPTVPVNPLFSGIGVLNLAGTVVIDTTTGLITIGGSPTTDPFVFIAGSNTFFFDRMDLNGNITVQGSNTLKMTGEQNSLGNTITVSAATTFTFSGAPTAIELKADFGSISIGNNITLPGSIDIAAPNGNVNMTSGTISTQIAGQNSGNVDISAGGGIDLGTISAFGTASSGKNGGSVTVTAGGGVNLVGSISSSGAGSATGNGGNAGSISITASGDINMSSAAPASLVAQGGIVTSAGATGGNGGTISLSANLISSLPSSGTPATIRTIGGNSTGTAGIGGNAGNINLTATTSTADAIHLISGTDTTIVNATGGTGPAGGSNGNGGTVTFTTANSNSKITGVSATGNPDIDARAGNGAGAAGTDGSVVGSPTLVTADVLP